jgi:hypothetical protein
VSTLVPAPPSLFTFKTISECFFTQTVVFMSLCVARHRATAITQLLIWTRHWNLSLNVNIPLNKIFQGRGASRGSFSLVFVYFLIILRLSHNGFPSENYLHCYIFSFSWKDLISRPIGSQPDAIQFCQAIIVMSANYPNSIKNYCFKVIT